MDQHALLLLAAFVTQIKANAGAAFIIDRMQTNKSAIFAWISKETPWATRIVSSLFAAATAFGIRGTYNLHTGGTITIPGAAVLLGAAWAFTENYALQHAWGKVIAADWSALKKTFGGIPGALAGSGVGVGLTPQPQSGGAAPQTGGAKS